MSSQIRLGAKMRLAATCVLIGIALSGCAGAGRDGGSGVGEDTVEGVPAGATKEEYIAAFEDVEPIELFTQTSGPKGGATGQNIESYAAQVEEWSGGKITFDIAFSNAVAPPLEIDNALVDGRLDMGNVLALYEPSDFPVTNALINGGILSEGSPVVGVLQSNAWMSEVAFNTPEFMEEWEGHGLVPLVPFYEGGGAVGFYCSEPRDSLDSIQGTTVATSTGTQGRQIEALGGSPVSIVYTEFFESLQRGVVDCIVTNASGASLGGFVPEAPHVVVDPEARFAITPGQLVFGKAKWDSLPLVAKQLLWDSLRVYYEENITIRNWPIISEIAVAVEDGDGSFLPLKKSAREAVLEVNEGILDDLRSSNLFDGEDYVDRAIESSDRWTAEIEELGFDPDLAYEEFPDWLTDPADLSDYLDKVMTDVFGPHRP